MASTTRRPITIVSLSLAIAFLLAACAPGGGACRVWDTPLPVSQDLANRLEAKVESEIMSRNSGPFRLEVTQEEATSYLALNVRDYPLERPEIRFSQGLVYLSGTVTALRPIRGDLSASFLPQISDGLVTLRIEEACLMGVSVPEFIRDRIGRIVNDSIADARPHISVQQLEILEGTVIATGQITQS